MRAGNTGRSQIQVRQASTINYSHKYIAYAAISYNKNSMDEHQRRPLVQVARLHRPMAIIRNHCPAVPAYFEC